MLVLLPPSETKANCGSGQPLELDRLSFVELDPVRRKLIDALIELAADQPASKAALGLSERQVNEIERNCALRTAPTMPALQRYTGVLYDALDAASFTRAETEKANRRVVIASALFGLLRAGDRIPAYRLSAGNIIPAIGSLRALWRPSIEPVLDQIGDLIVDLRSGPYAALARVHGAVTVRVVSRGTDGGYKTVSHHNKAYKGRLAGALVKSRKEPTTVDGLITAISAAGIGVTRVGERDLQLSVDP